MKYIINTLLILSLITGCAWKTSETGRIRVIFDTDCNNELDDQHALAYLLFNGDIFDIEGITVNRTHNGGDIESHYEEAMRVVKLCSLENAIPVYRGASADYSEIVADIENPEFDGWEAVDFIIRQAHKKDDRPLVLLPVGKLTTIALALKKDPSIIPNVRIVWLGSNYPDPGEYNLVNDVTAVNPVIESRAAFEMATVRYGKPSGTDAVRASLEEIKHIMPGKGPVIEYGIEGRNGGFFNHFGDYSVDLFTNINEPSRALFDMAAVAIVKNAQWAERTVIPAPELTQDGWKDRPDNVHTIVIWEQFDRDGIMEDFYRRMDNYVLPE